jgi:hypothetical protein
MYFGGLNSTEVLLLGMLNALIPFSPLSISDLSSFLLTTPLVDGSLIVLSSLPGVFLKTIFIRYCIIGYWQLSPESLIETLFLA